MFQLRAFNQTAVKAGRPRGICFRVSYKWASCKFRNVAFGYELLNINKTYNKQMAYLHEPDLVRAEGAGMATGYYAWVLAAHRNDQYYIDAWGRNHGNIKCRAHRVLGIADYMGDQWENEYFVYCFYGRTAAGAAWGHAVAFSGSPGEGARFFDSNRGEYGFAEVELVGPAIDNYCATEYENGGDVVEDRYVYSLYV